MSDNASNIFPGLGAQVWHAGQLWTLASRILVSWDGTPYNVLRASDGSEIGVSDEQLMAWAGVTPEAEEPA